MDNGNKAISQIEYLPEHEYKCTICRKDDAAVRVITKDKTEDFCLWCWNLLQELVLKDKKDRFGQVIQVVKGKDGIKVLM